MMCGICGVFNFKGGSSVDRSVLTQMNDSLVHRGPDDDGYHVDGRIGLAQRRLSIIDLSTGHQPIYNEEQTIVMVCNGEIYNYVELRKELLERGHKFKTRSDSEVIVHLYEEMGLAFPSRLEGMFAIAIWDSIERQLILCRDRVGIKPLFYYSDSERVVFASELKAIHKHPDVDLRIDGEAFCDYLNYSFIPGPKSIFEKCKKLKPGHLLRIHSSGEIEENCYWNVPSFEEDELFSKADLVDRTAALLDAAVKSHLVSDVPFGCFLSGGIDSSLVAAFMSKNLDAPVKTFSIGFEEEEYNELGKARTVARALKTDHTEHVVTADIRDTILKLARQFDEPFADPSAIPTYLVSQIAAQDVKMCMSGDGGDELFAGYKRYSRNLDRLWCDEIPRSIKKLSRGIGNRIQPGVRGKTFLGQLGLNRDERYADSLRVFNQDDRDHFLTSEFSQSMRGYDSRAALTQHFDREGDFINQMGYVDFRSYLVDSNLQKVDRASMLASLEVRVPLLDRSLVEFAFSIPGRYKMPAGNLKALLKGVAETVLPNEIIHLPKKGFSVPISRWSRNELRGMISEVIFDSSGTLWNYLDRNYVERMFKRHMDGKSDFSRQLWTLMNFNLWANNFYRSS